MGIQSNDVKLEKSGIMNRSFKIHHFLITDLKLIFRDKSLIIFLFIPFVVLAFLKYAIPAIVRFYPAFTNYYTLVLGLLALVMSVFPGFIMAFIIIDEREQNILDVFRVLPVSFSKLIYRRTFLTALLSFAYSFVILEFSDLVILERLPNLAVSILNSFLGPISALLIVSFASNKIEGMTYMKGINFIWIIPVAYFFIDSPLKYVFAIIPDYWTLQIIYGNANPSNAFLIGFVFHLLVLIITAKIFIQKMAQS